VRWETEWSFDGKLCQEYECQKLLESGHCFSSYDPKCRGCFFFETQCTSISNSFLNKLIGCTVDILSENYILFSNFSVKILNVC